MEKNILIGFEVLPYTDPQVVGVGRNVEDIESLIIRHIIDRMEKKEIDLTSIPKEPDLIERFNYLMFRLGTPEFRISQYTIGQLGRKEEYGLTNQLLFEMLVDANVLA